MANLDLTNADPRQVARVVELAHRSDVLLATYVPGAGHWAGIGPDRWLEINPRLTVVVVSPWGSSGPWADRPVARAFDWYTLGDSWLV